MSRLVSNPRISDWLVACVEWSRPDKVSQDCAPLSLDALQAGVKHDVQSASAIVWHRDITACSLRDHCYKDSTL